MLALKLHQDNTCDHVLPQLISDARKGMTQGMSCNSRHFGPSANDPLNSFWQAAIGPTVILNRQEYRDDGLQRLAAGG